MLANELYKIALGALSDQREFSPELVHFLDGLKHEADRGRLYKTLTTEERELVKKHSRELWGLGFTILRTAIPPSPYRILWEKE